MTAASTLDTQNPAEAWAPVPGREDLYEVSDQGRVLYRSRVRRGAICEDPGLLEEVIKAKYREIVSSGS